MPRLCLLAVISLYIINGCASADDKRKCSDAADSYPNLIELKKPSGSSLQTGKVYIDSIKQVTTESKEALLIAGKLADGCTYLQSVNHRVEDHTLILELSTWRDTEAMCTQALVPFSYIYGELNSEGIATYSQATVNGKTYSF